MAVGKASGEDRARIAAEMAISSQLLDITIDGARGILFNVTGAPGLTLFEVNQAAAIIKETAHPDVNLIFGAVLDPNMGEEIRVTVIATGFDRASSIRPIPNTPVNDRHNRSEEHSSQRPIQPVDRSERVPSPQPVQSSFEARVVNTEDLDLPPFLRNQHRK